MEFAGGIHAIGRLADFQREEVVAILVGSYSEKDKSQAQLHLEELERLADTFGVTTILKIVCPLRKIDVRTFLGKGKVAEIGEQVSNYQANMVIFDNELTPQQQRNLEKKFQAAVIDRRELILGVFATRARTKEAKIQVDLANLNYQLPRLKRLWTHLSRQRVGGGRGGFLKGEGERQIEIDRRILRKKITHLEKELASVKKKRELKRVKRLRQELPSFAIVGYTNAGKSTLLNALTEAEAFAEDKLFATLDTKSKTYILPNKQKILLIDTVGFVRKLPHNLVTAFKSTLEESLSADILIHLIDSSSPSVLEEIAATEEVLQELGAANKPIIRVLNKVDLEENLAAKLLHYKYPKLIRISAEKKDNLIQLTDAIEEILSKKKQRIQLIFDQKDYSHAAKILRQEEVLSTNYKGNTIIIEARLSKRVLAQLERLPVKSCLLQE